MMNEESPGSAAADEQRWLGQARAGDPDAFGELCRAHEGRLLREAIALGHALGLAEDLVQETLVAAWKSLRRYDGSCRFHTWLCAILLNRHRTQLRRKRLSWLSRLWPEARPQDCERAVTEEPAPDQAAQARDDARLLRHCLMALPPKQRQVLFLRFYADDSLEGIAAAMGCSVGTVKSRLFHGLANLREMKALRPARPERQNHHELVTTRLALL